MASYRQIIQTLKNKREPSLPLNVIQIMISHFNLDWRHRICNVCKDIFHIDGKRVSFYCELCQVYYHSYCTKKYVREIHDFQVDNSYEQIICPHHNIGKKGGIDRKLQDLNKRIEFDDENVICLVETDINRFKPEIFTNQRCKNHHQKWDKVFFWNLFTQEYQCRHCIRRTTHHDKEENIDTQFHNYQDIQYRIFPLKSDRSRWRRDEIFQEVFETTMRKVYFST